MSVGSGYLENFFKDKSVFKGESTRDSPNYKIYTGLSGSVLGKLPSRLQDEKHIFCENYVGF